MKLYYSCLASILELLEARLDYLEQDDLNRLQDQCHAAANAIFHMSAVIGQLLIERQSLERINHLVNENDLAQFTGEWIAFTGEVSAQLQSVNDTAELITCRRGAS